ncbi:MAG: UvrB/UvrC motif-containing protein [Kiritimatiellia bacterium]
MKCQNCGEQEATVHVKQSINGVQEEIYLCARCAEAKGINLTGPLSLADFLFAGKDTVEETDTVESLTCPECHMSKSDFRKLSRLGCPACYTVFRRELEPMLSRMHNSPAHVGKVPEKERIPVQIASARRELKEAVKAEKFEKAAVLRDQLSDLARESGESKSAENPGLAREENHGS